MISTQNESFSPAQRQGSSNCLYSILLRLTGSHLKDSNGIYYVDPLRVIVVMCKGNIQDEANLRSPWAFMGRLNNMFPVLTSDKEQTEFSSTITILSPSGFKSRAGITAVFNFYVSFHRKGNLIPLWTWSHRACFTMVSCSQSKIWQAHRSCNELNAMNPLRSLNAKSPPELTPNKITLIHTKFNQNCTSIELLVNKHLFQGWCIDNL